MKIIEEHERCSHLTSDINSWLRQLLVVYYYFSVIPIDLGLMTLIFERNLIYRLPIIFVAMVILVNLFYVNYFLILVGREAHSCYPLLNSLVVTKSLNIMLKLKTMTLLEKLGGPLIGFYCLDLFPFDNYNFYLFIVNCVSNFMLFINLI